MLIGEPTTSVEIYNEAKKSRSGPHYSTFNAHFDGLILFFFKPDVRISLNRLNRIWGNCQLKSSIILRKLRILWRSCDVLITLLIIMLKDLSNMKRPYSQSYTNLYYMLNVLQLTWDSSLSKKEDIIFIGIFYDNQYRFFFFLRWHWHTTRATSKGTRFLSAKQKILAMSNLTEISRILVIQCHIFINSLFSKSFLITVHNGLCRKPSMHFTVWK